MAILDRSSHAEAAPMATCPELSILIVSWNCRDILSLCLHELFASTINFSFEVIVVDNASTDDTVETIPRLFPHIRLVPNTDNLGFAKANNQGIGLARGELIMLLNPDAFPSTPETFNYMVYFLREHPQYAGVGCKLVHADGSHQVGDAGFRVTPGNVMAYATGLSQLFPGRVGLFLGAVPSTSDWIDVDWICGAFFIVRRSVVDAVGGLDERYFMYGEDVEWGCRIRQQGHRLAYVPGQTVIHLQGGTQSAGAPATLSTRWLDGLAMVYRQLNAGRHRLWFKLPMAAGLALRATAYLALAIIFRRADSRAKSRAMWQYAGHLWAAPWRTQPDKTGSGA